MQSHPTGFNLSGVFLLIFRKLNVKVNELLLFLQT